MEEVGDFTVGPDARNIRKEGGKGGTGWREVVSQMGK